jgi:hypothetical protein
MPSDKEGVEAAMEWLEGKGFTEINNIHKPVDLSANFQGMKYWIEVKYTETKNKLYFGAATISEWGCAINNPENFFFLVVQKPGGVNADSYWNFELIKAIDFIKFSTIPPFKINFNLPLNEPRKIPKRRSAVQASTENIKMCIDFYNSIK